MAPPFALEAACGQLDEAAPRLRWGGWWWVGEDFAVWGARAWSTDAVEATAAVAASPLASSAILATFGAASAPDAKHGSVFSWFRFLALVLGCEISAKVEVCERLVLVGNHLTVIGDRNPYITLKPPYTLASGTSHVSFPNIPMPATAVHRKPDICVALLSIIRTSPNLMLG